MAGTPGPHTARARAWNDPGSVSFVCSNYIDDGAVVYLNGAEAFRYNLVLGREIVASDLALAANPA